MHSLPMMQMQYTILVGGPAQLNSSLSGLLFQQRKIKPDRLFQDGDMSLPPHLQQNDCVTQEPEGRELERQADHPDICWPPVTDAKPRQQGRRGHSQYNSPGASFELC